MPINFDLENLRQKFNCVNYFETGLWDPRQNVSSTKALECNFKKVFCIEIRKDFVNLGNQIFNKEIQSGRYNLFNDDSVNMIKYLKTDDFNNKTLFFLDAHVDNYNISNYKKKCPLFEELTAIKSLPRNDNIILIDDLRIIKNSFPWGETSYGNINFLDSIINLILSINNNYKFTTLNGHVENDVLLAYI
jgi:hypothetical protein